MDKKEEVRTMLLKELRKISFPNSIIRDLQRNESDGDYLLELRECAITDWNFAYVGALCETDCSHEHDAQWKAVFQNSVKNMVRHREMIDEWLEERCPEGRYAEPSDCTHLDEKELFN